MATAPANSACAVALGTTELREDVILHLPLNRIVLAQRVSQDWQATIRQSPRIQQALFLQPLPKGQVAFQRLPVSGDWTWNTYPYERVEPILNPLVHDLFFLKSYDHYRPFLHRGFVVPILETCSYTKTINYSQIDVEGPVGPRSDKHLQQLHSLGASWRSMLVMQPTCSHLSISFRDARPELTIFASGGGGVTLQDVLDGLRAKWHVDLKASKASSEHIGHDPVMECWSFRGCYTRDLQILDGSLPTACDLLRRLEVV